MDIFATGKRVKHGNEHGPKIPANFYGSEKTFKLAQKPNNKDWWKVKRNCKKMSKLKCIQTSYEEYVYATKMTF